MALYPPAPPILPPMPRQRPSMTAPTLNAPTAPGRPVMAPPLGAPPILPPGPAGPVGHGATRPHDGPMHGGHHRPRPALSAPEAPSFAAPRPDGPPDIERAIARRNRKPQPY